MDAERKGELKAADLLVDAIYQGGRSGNASDDPLPHLVGVSNQGGFRYIGSKGTRTKTQRFSLLSRTVCFSLQHDHRCGICDDCGETFLVTRGCGCGKHKGEDDGRVQAFLDQMRGRELRERQAEANRKA